MIEWQVGCGSPDEAFVCLQRLFYERCVLKFLQPKRLQRPSPYSTSQGHSLVLALPAAPLIAISIVFAISIAWPTTC